MASFQVPYIFQGKIYDSESAPKKSATVTITNESTGDTQTAVTGSTGDYVFDCANFTNGWTNGDIVNMVVTGTGTAGKNLRVKVVSLRGNNTQIKLLEVAYT